MTLPLIQGHINYIVFTTYYLLIRDPSKPTDKDHDYTMSTTNTEGFEA